jgi:dihydroorotate dehydrogenase
VCGSEVAFDRPTLYRLICRPFLFQLDPERAHEFTLRALRQLSRTPSLFQAVMPHLALDHALLRTHLYGLSFPNPVGLAAGFDKSAMAVAALPILGFGFVEVGTVTPRPQRGNPRPRVFRCPADGAVINRLGFNNDGATTVAQRLRALPRRVPIGVNIGKNADTPLDRALDDYQQVLKELCDVGDYLVVNVSSPNTPGLRALQAGATLYELLTSLHAYNRQLAHERQLPPRPLLVKIAPDLTAAELDDIVEVVQSVPLDGIIATNTTVSRQGLSRPVAETGGVSGRPLRQRSTEIIRYLYARLQGRIPIIGVGGIFTAEDAYDKIRAGASLVQVYTGLIYEGPTLPYRINRGLVQLLQRDGFAALAEAVGSAHRPPLASRSQL